MLGSTATTAGMLNMYVDKHRVYVSRSAEGNAVSRYTLQWNILQCCSQLVSCWVTLRGVIVPN